MKSHFRSAVRVLVGMTLTAAVGVGSAQTPAQMEYERQQREYRQQLERQREQQQQQQQLMNENARRQQEQSSRVNAPAPQPGYAPPTQGSSGGTQGGRGADPTGGEAASAARAMWEKRPALPPDRNPLLGKWTRPASTRTNSSDPFAALAAMAKGGLCEVLFGGGIFEFRPDRLVGMDERTPPQELDRVEYRGDAKRVVVLPKTTFKLIEFDFEGPDRINWASQKCVLVRVGAASSSASAAKPATSASAARCAVGEFRLDCGRRACLFGGRAVGRQQGRGPHALGVEAGCSGSPDPRGFEVDPVCHRPAELDARLRREDTRLRKGHSSAAGLQRRLRNDRCQWSRSDTLAGRSLLGVKRCESRRQANDVARARGCEGG